MCSARKKVEKDLDLQRKSLPQKNKSLLEGENNENLQVEAWSINAKEHALPEEIIYVSCTYTLMPTY